jgi:hypothetical protein
METSEHRAIATRTYNVSWEYLEQPELSSDDATALLTAAFTSRFHWSHAGEAEQWAIADWMVSRAAAAVGYGALAVDYARRAHDSVSGGGFPDWLVASAAEGLSRAYAAAGDATQREAWRSTATELVAAISDEEDRRIITEQLATVPH